MTAEQQARDLLERMGVDGAQQMTAGDVVELANLIEQRDHLARTLKRALDDFDDPRTLSVGDMSCDWVDEARAAMASSQVR